MNSENPKIITLLKSIKNAKRKNRDRVAIIVHKDKNLHKDLIKTVFLVNEKVSIRAAWVLEWICTHYALDFILPYLDEFCNNIHKLSFDGAIRPCAKICEELATAFYKKGENEVKASLQQNHINQIIETGFDWLITLQKIAVRAYTMNTLYLFGTEKDWIHPELKHLINSKIIHESKGCKARGRKVLELIEKARKISS